MCNINILILIQNLIRGQSCSYPREDMLSQAVHRDLRTKIGYDVVAYSSVTKYLRNASYFF
jgi:hypothetical protein